MCYSERERKRERERERKRERKREKERVPRLWQGWHWMIMVGRYDGKIQ
jgi:hypothetical protein